MPCKSGFIIGGGPSLRKFDFELLRGYRCLAVNMAFKNVPWAEIAWIGDTRLLDRLVGDSEWIEFAGDRFTRADQFARARHLQPTTIHPVATISRWSGMPGAVVALGNAGLSAMNLAEQFSWNPIFLLGFDSKGDRGDGRMANYHDHYPKEWAKPESFSRQKFVRIFDEVKNSIRAKVYNCSPDSALECFEKITFEEALEKCSQCELSPKPS